MEGAAFLGKADERLASAEAEFAAGRYNGCSNRAYYACFQAAVAALIRHGTRTSGRGGRWGHAFVESELVGQLINRRHRFPRGLRSVLARNRAVREQGDYDPDGVTAVEAERSLRRARDFVRSLAPAERADQ